MVVDLFDNGDQHPLCQSKGHCSAECDIANVSSVTAQQYLKQSAHARQALLSLTTSITAIIH